MSNTINTNPNLNYQNDITPSFDFIIKDVALKALLFFIL